MRLFEMTPEQREAYVAKMLGFSDDVDTWPRDVIDELIKKAGRIAERQLAEDVAKIGNRYWPSSQG